MKIKFLYPLFIALALSLFPKPAAADGIIIPDPPICDPGHCPPMPIPISQLEIRYHHVAVTINDQIAITHVDQVLYNPNDWVVEGTYFFPIPQGAAVTNFILWIDGQAVEGKILEADEARMIYEEIVRELKDPALLEYASQDAVQARIYPIPPGGERRIELEYSEILESDSGLVRYLYPLNTEKFSTKALNEVSVSVDVKSNVPIRAAYSPSHPVDVMKDGRFHITAGYEDRNVKPDTDFTLFYSIGENEAFHLLSYRDPSGGVGEDGFFTLLLAPRPDAGTQTLPKDIIMVLDRSGSMEGEKFRQAQSALKFILTHLNPEDRFNLIAFSTSIEMFSGEMSELDEVERAESWVNQLAALGSTDINRALLEAGAAADQERPTYLIFLTDGLPTEGVVDSAEIIKNFEAFAPSNLRLFVYGVGYDVDTYLLDSLADNHHGTSSYVLPGENLDEVLSSFYAKISTPVLTDLSLEFGNIDVYDLYPSPLPDLFDGSQITIVGRYRGSGITEITLKGLVNDRTLTIKFPDQTFTKGGPLSGEGKASLQYIPRLWATRKIGYLLNNIRLHGADQETIDQIVRISIRYGIVTPYTSYLVTEPMPLGAAEQDRIAEEQFMELESAPNEPTYGRDAVEKSAAQGEMEGADVVAAPMVEASNVVRVIGSRTFVWSHDAWVDTAFDPEIMQTVKVAFLSDDYFSLADSRLDLAAAFALGSSVIVISEGIVYEVVDSETHTDPIDIPPAIGPDDQGTENIIVVVPTAEDG
ncbi:MAG: VWA domain-containing protein, partial [Deltaproteobacteria bacterium]|nr:VWA domain-containing protein [Deltaproteobacteria bacterium]